MNITTSNGDLILKSVLPHFAAKTTQTLINLIKATEENPGFICDLKNVGKIVTPPKIIECICNNC